MPRKLLATLATSLLLATAACSDDGSDAQVLTGDAALAALQSAPDAVAEVGSGRVELTIDMALEGESVSFTADGVFDGDSFQMSLDFAEIAAAMGEELPEGMDEPMQVVSQGTRVYMRMPFMEEVLGSKPWISMTPEDLGAAGESLGFGGGGNPAQLLETLRGAGEVEVIGTQVIRGVEATGYRTEVDLAEAMKEIPEKYRELVASQLGEVTGTMPVEIWLDADGLPRRVVMDMSSMFGSLVDQSGDGALSGSMDFYDYGTDVDIELPDASEVTSFDEFLGLMGGLGGGQGFEETGEEIG